LETYFFCWSCP